MQSFLFLHGLSSPPTTAPYPTCVPQAVFRHWVNSNASQSWAKDEQHPARLVEVSNTYMQVFPVVGRYSGMKKEMYPIGRVNVALDISLRGDLE